ncbi:MAG: archease [Spirochaetes bacterium]|nr:archease [Spirochaetota bacterium]
MSPFRIVDHTADIAVVIEAKDQKTLLLEGIRALYSVITGGRYDDVSCNAAGRLRWVRIRIGFATFDTLFIDFLNRIVKMVDMYGVLPVDVVPRIGTRRAVLKVGFVKAGKDGIIREIKAATHHNYRVRKTPSGLCTTVTFDV